MIIPMLCVTIFVILVVWFLLPRVARLMIHTPTAISIFVCLSMVQLMAVFISMRCTLCGHFLQVALTLILVVRSEERRVGKECRSRGAPGAKIINNDAEVNGPVRVEERRVGNDSCETRAARRPSTDESVDI